MVSKTMVVKAAEGLHMRPAGVIAREAGKFDSDVTIVFGDKRINAKSLVNIIAHASRRMQRLHSSVRELMRKQHLQRWKSSRQTTSEINQPAKSIGGVICTKESPAQKESE